MQLNDNNQHEEKKKNLAVLRTGYITKKAEVSKTKLVLSPYRSLEFNSKRLLHPWIPFFETKGEIQYGEHAFNKFKLLNSFDIRKMNNLEVVTLYPKDSKDDSYEPWNYNIQRLYSLGNSNVLPWAQAAEGFWNLFKEPIDILISSSEDKNFTSWIEDALEFASDHKNKSIEENFPFAKIVIGVDAVKMKLISESFSSTFLELIGHTPNSFTSWVIKNGLPQMYELNSTMHLEMFIEFLKLTSTETGEFHSEKEFPCYLFDRTGYKRRFKMVYSIERRLKENLSLLINYVYIKGDCIQCLPIEPDEYEEISEVSDKTIEEDPLAKYYSKN